MIRKNILSGAAALLLVSLIAMVLAVIYAPKSISDPIAPLGQPKGAVPVRPISEEFVLKTYEGRLAVFSYGRDEPDTVFNVYVNRLPHYDQGQLNQGVTAKNYEELLRLIEDYIS